MGEIDKLEDVGYLQDIVSYIFDEKKIVTYKWISNTLAVHVNKAKQLLYICIKHVSEERLKDLKVTYLVGGILPENKGCRLQVVSEEDLEKVKAQFKIVTSEHIYSICLKNCLLDLHHLCSVDGVKDSKVGRHGAIQCAKGVSRSSEELASKRQGAHVAVVDEKQWPTSQSKQEKQSSSGNSDKKSSKSAGSISAMFSAQSNKGKIESNGVSKGEEKDENTSSSDTKPSETKSVAKGGKPPASRLAAMFSAQNAKPRSKNQEESKSKNEMKVPTKETSTQQKEVNSEENKRSLSKDIQDKPSKIKKSKSESKKSKQKKRKASDNTEEKGKRRKRIVVMDDSSSDDDVFGSDEETSPSPVPVVDTEEMEDPMEIENPQEPEHQQETMTDGHHKRKRKLVDKTFEDEEGYVVTKKVYEFVSCSESENEEEKENDKTTDSKNKKEIDKITDSQSNNRETGTTAKEAKGAQKTRKSSPQKKNSPPEKKKQATLMSFFKRN